MCTAKRAGSLLLISLLLAALLCAMLPAGALAATEVTYTREDMHEPPFTETKAAAADAIDQFLDAAFEFWLEGDTAKAYEHVDNAYFVVYEVTGFERQTMSYVNGARKNACELQFSVCKGAVKKEVTEENKVFVRTELLKLKTMMREDANKLDARKGLPASEMTFWENGVRVDYDPYGELVGDMSAKPKYATWTEAAEAVVDLLDTSYNGYIKHAKDVGYDNYNTAFYSVYEESGLASAVYTYLGLERREELDRLFDDYKQYVYEYEAGGSLKKTMIKKPYRALTKGILAAAGEVDERIAAEKAAEEEARKAEAQAAAPATATDTASSGAGWAVFAGSFGIILREGLEAILVISAIIAYLVKSGNKRYVSVVYIGSLLGILASFGAAALLNYLKWASSAQQEIIEGVTALIAVVVLFYVSNWMISKAEADSWTRYIDRKVRSSTDDASGKASWLTLGFTAFLSVFREGAEVVLFYQPMLAEGDPGMVWAGFGVGCVVLVGVFLAFRFLSIKLPIKLFFTATSILMAAMCVSFLGSGIKELAEGGVFDVTNIPWMPQQNDVLDVLGIYPCVETVIPQVAMIGILVATFLIAHYRNKIASLKADLEEVKA